MKKLIFVIPLTILLSGLFSIKSYAATADQAGFVITKYVDNIENNVFPAWNVTIVYYNFDHWDWPDPPNNAYANYFYYGQNVWVESFDSSYDIDSLVALCRDYVGHNPISNVTVNSRYTGTIPSIPGNIVYVSNYPYRYTPPGVEVIDYFNPTPPEPGDDWLSDIWEWFLWQLGINDDYSGDIDAYITGGDRERMEMVTPSPTPSPTPVPSPTPYSLDIIDNNGNPVYSITGIPGSTFNITNTTNNNDGSDFDIFDVDLKIGDGGSTNPRDGLNDVMDTSLTYLSDPENVDMQPVGDSFSIIPNDWFLLLGVVACFPFIAGFISKLLK